MSYKAENWHAISHEQYFVKKAPEINTFTA